jgi:hypothetical protein
LRRMMRVAHLSRVLTLLIIWVLTCSVKIEITVEKGGRSCLIKENDQQQRCEGDARGRVSGRAASSKSDSAPTTHPRPNYYIAAVQQVKAAAGKKLLCVGHSFCRVQVDAHEYRPDLDLCAPQSLPSRRATAFNEKIIQIGRGLIFI